MVTEKHSRAGGVSVGGTKLQNGQVEQFGESIDQSLLEMLKDLKYGDDEGSFVDRISDTVNEIKADLVKIRRMALVGDFGLSQNQQEMQLAVWSVMGAPLMLSADVTSLSAHAQSLLTNKMAVAINQDSLGVMGRQKAMVCKIWFNLSVMS